MCACVCTREKREIRGIASTATTTRARTNTHLAEHALDGEAGGDLVQVYLSVHGSTREHTAIEVVLDIGDPLATVTTLVHDGQVPRVQDEEPAVHLDLTPTHARGNATMRRLEHTHTADTRAHLLRDRNRFTAQADGDAHGVG
jgi:hypothetical protein